MDIVTDCVLENAPPDVLPLIEVTRLCVTVPTPFIEPGIVLFRTKLSELDSFSLKPYEGLLVETRG